MPSPAPAPQVVKRREDEPKEGSERFRPAYPPRLSSSGTARDFSPSVVRG